MYMSRESRERESEGRAGAHKGTDITRDRDCFHMRLESKVRNLNDHSNDGILDRVKIKLHRDA